MSLKSKIAKGIIGLVEDAIDLAVKKEVAPEALLELVVAGKVPLLARGGRVKSRAA